jgi:hypothetical protein
MVWYLVKHRDKFIFLPLYLTSTFGGTLIIVVPSFILYHLAQDKDKGWALLDIVMNL